MASTDTDARKSAGTTLAKTSKADKSNAKKFLAKRGSSQMKTLALSHSSLLIVQDVERNYAQLVNGQLARLRTTPVYAESPHYFGVFKQQLKQIERDEAALKKDIRQQGLNDELLQGLINISQQKLNVLKDLQVEIRKLNAKVQTPGGGADTIKSYYLNL